jgi:hypothetical protein
MIQITHLVENRIDEIAEYYENEGRYEALIYLRESVVRARSEIGKDPNQYSSYPSTYRKLAKLGLRWRKFHRYWFGWTMSRGFPVVISFDYDENDMPRRIMPDRVS